MSFMDAHQPYSGLQSKPVSWYEPSSMERPSYLGAAGPNDVWSAEQVTELLSTMDDLGGPSSASGDSNYTYAADHSSAAPPVVLSPSWSLPRRVDNSGLASLAEYQAANPLPDTNDVNIPSSLSSQSSHNTLSASPQAFHNILFSPAPFHPQSTYNPQVSSAPAMPFSAPAEAFHFGEDLFQRPSSLQPEPYTDWMSSPPQSTPSPLPQVARAGTLPPEDISTSNPGIFNRRRSISMSAMDLEAAAAAASAATGPVRPKPSRHRSASNVSGKGQVQRAPSGHAQDSLYPVPRSPSAKERRAVASKRRATLQSVIADAKLPSSSPALPPAPSAKNYGEAALPPPRKPSPVAPAQVTLQQALEGITVATSYMEQQAGSQGTGEAGFVTQSHVHLLRDIRARLRATSEGQ